MLGDKAAAAADAMQAEYFRAFLEQERLELVARLAAQTPQLGRRDRAGELWCPAWLAWMSTCRRAMCAATWPKRCGGISDRIGISTPSLATSSRNGPTWSARILIWRTCPDRITSQGGWIGRSSPKAATGISSRATECVDWLSSWPPRAMNWETCGVA